MTLNNCAHFPGHLDCHSVVSCVERKFGRGKPLNEELEPLILAPVLLTFMWDLDIYSFSFYMYPKKSMARSVILMEAGQSPQKTGQGHREVRDRAKNRTHFLHSQVSMPKTVAKRRCRYIYREDTESPSGFDFTSLNSKHKMYVSLFCSIGISRCGKSI